MCASLFWMVRQAHLINSEQFGNWRNCYCFDWIHALIWQFNLNIFFYFTFEPSSIADLPSMFFTSAIVSKNTGTEHSLYNTSARGEYSVLSIFLWLIPLMSPNLTDLTLTLFVWPRIRPDANAHAKRMIVFSHRQQRMSHTAYRYDGTNYFGIRKLFVVAQVWLTHVTPSSTAYQGFSTYIHLMVDQMIDNINKIVF